MSLTLRIILFAVSLLCSSFILINIRKAKVKIEDSVYWILFSLLLIVIGAFPNIAIWCAVATGVQSPANFVFLFIIFLLLVKLFSLTIKLSKLESKVQTLAQRMAIDHYNEENKE